MKKKRVIIILLVIIIVEIISLFIVVFRSFVPKKSSVSSVDVKEKIKEIESKDVQDISDDNFTDEYKEYQSLTLEEQQELEVIPRKEKVDIDTIDDIIDEQDSIDIPSYFNLSDKITINVENQGSYGLCWAFASLKTIETFLELHNGHDYNLSEIKLDYITSNLMYGYRPIHSGGSFDVFEDYLMRTGPKIEYDSEYHDYSSSEYNDFIDEEDVTRVTDTINFPALLKDEVSLEEVDKFRNSVKTHIIQNGAVYATITMPTGVNHFCSDMCFANHAVTIVGWDDDYSRSNFKSATGDLPVHDGAYIAINSWGESWGNNGYFYISYDDLNVEREMSGITSISLKSSKSLDLVTSEEVKSVLDENYSYAYIDNSLTNLVIKKITYLDLEDIGLDESDIESLNIFSNLVYLNLSKNNLKSIDKLNIDKLVSLDLSYNSIKDVSSLNLSKLKYLILSNNKGVVGFDNLSGLETLDLDNCDIKVLDLTNFKKLYYLNLSNNPIDYVYFNSDFDSIDLVNSGIVSFSQLKNLKNVYYLNLANNNIVSLDGIDSINEISSLNLSGNSIKDISAIEGMKFNFIDLSNNQIDNIEFINGVVANSVFLENNDIKDISRFKNDNIESINLSGNPDIIDYSSLGGVKSVIIRDNKISNAEMLESLTDVEFLDVSNNDIGNITPLNSLVNLKSLYLDNNSNISGILENNVEFLSLKNCSLKDFDITRLSKLNSIDVSNNDLSIVKLLQSKSDNLYVSADNISLTLQDLNYLIDEKNSLNNRQIYFGLYKPIISIDINDAYDLSSFKWLKIDSSSQIINGVVKDGLLYAIDKSNPIVMYLSNQIGYNIYSPIVIFNVS